MPGRAPDPNARRTNHRKDWRRLPSGGRPGAPPAWPLGACSAAAAKLWGELWATPQAQAWAENEWTRVVARYVRKVLEAEKSGAPMALLAEVRQMEDRLGLNPLAMRKLYWLVDDGGVAVEEGSGIVDLDSYRDRLG